MLLAGAVGAALLFAFQASHLPQPVGASSGSAMPGLREPEKTNPVLAASASLPTSVAVDAAVPSAAPLAASPKPPPVARQPSAAPPVRAAPERINCNPPYEFDTEGKKHWKAECL